MIIVSVHVLYSGQDGLSVTPFYIVLVGGQGLEEVRGN